MEQALLVLVEDFKHEPIESTRRDSVNIPGLGLCTFGFVTSKADELVNFTLESKNATIIWDSYEIAYRDFHNQQWIKTLKLY